MCPAAFSSIQVADRPLIDIESNEWQRDGHRAKIAQFSITMNAAAAATTTKTILIQFRSDSKRFEAIYKCENNNNNKTIRQQSDK